MGSNEPKGELKELSLTRIGGSQSAVRRTRCNDAALQHESYVAERNQCHAAAWLGRRWRLCASERLALETRSHSQDVRRRTRLTGCDAALCGSTGRDRPVSLCREHLSRDKSVGLPLASGTGGTITTCHPRSRTPVGCSRPEQTHSQLRKCRHRDGGYPKVAKKGTEASGDRKRKALRLWVAPRHLAVIPDHRGSDQRFVSTLPARHSEIGTQNGNLRTTPVPVLSPWARRKIFARLKESAGESQSCVNLNL